MIIHEQASDISDIGNYYRRAIITCDNPADLASATAYYNKVTTVRMSLDAKIERAIYMKRQFNATYRHEYRRKGE